MKNIVLLLIVMITCASSLFSQNRTEDFKIAIPETRVSGSLYHTIGFIDAREDPDNMGFVQLGAFNTKARIVTKTSFPMQLSALVQALTDSTAENGALFFQLRKCSFAEITGSFSERGFFYLRGSLYAGKNNQYYRISSIDTMVLIKSMDVTKALLRNAGSVITNYISGDLHKAPADSMVYGFIELAKPDSLEKTKLRIYTCDQYTEGLYTSWQSFSSQIPDKQMTVELKKDKIKYVEFTDSSGKIQKVNPKDIYGIVYKGLPYVATAYGYDLLTRRDNDFYFTGKAKVSADPMSQMVATMMFGIVGDLLASNASSYFLMKLDHNNGSFIHIRQIVESTSQ